MNIYFAKFSTPFNSHHDFTSLDYHEAVISAESIESAKLLILKNYESASHIEIEELDMNQNSEWIVAN